MFGAFVLLKKEFPAPPSHWFMFRLASYSLGIHRNDDFVFIISKTFIGGIKK